MAEIVPDYIHSTMARKNLMVNKSHSERHPWLSRTTHTDTPTHTHTPCTHTDTHTDTHRHTHTDTHRHTHTHTHTHRHTHRHTQTHTDTQRHTHTHMRTHARTSKQARTHAHTHTHISDTCDAATCLRGPKKQDKGFNPNKSMYTGKTQVHGTGRFTAHLPPPCWAVDGRVKVSEVRASSSTIKLRGSKPAVHVRGRMNGYETWCRAHW